MESVHVIQQFFQVKIDSFLPFFINSYSNLSNNKAPLFLWSLKNNSLPTLPFQVCNLGVSLLPQPRPIKLHMCTVYIYRLINRCKQYLILVAYQVQQSVGSRIQRSVASLNQKKHCDMPNNKNQTGRAPRTKLAIAL